MNALKTIHSYKEQFKKDINESARSSEWGLGIQLTMYRDRVKYEWLCARVIESIRMLTNRNLCETMIKGSTVIRPVDKCSGIVMMKTILRKKNVNCRTITAVPKLMEI